MPGSVIVSGTRPPLGNVSGRSGACRPSTSAAWPSRMHSARPASRATRWTTSSWGTSSKRGQSQPSNAIAKAHKREGLTPDDIDLFEINEALFASVAIQIMRDIGRTPDNVDVNRGAISIGHPVGMSGARVVLHLALELKRRGGVGAAGLCGGGGQGDALRIRVPASST
jgi:acetyl-CoA acetyltransferase